MIPRNAHAGSRLALFWSLDRPARLLPCAETAGEMRDGLEAHLLRGLGRERRAPAAVAEEHEALVVGEHRLVVRALRIDPKLQHAARAVEGAGDAAVAVELADVAQIDEHDVAAAVQLPRLLDAERLDLPLRGIDQRAVPCGDFLCHGSLAQGASL